MTSAFEAAGNTMADGLRATFGLNATDKMALKAGVVAGIKSVADLSYGHDVGFERKFDM